MFAYIKNYLPRRLYVRAALILVLPIVILQLVVSVNFLQRHFEDVTRQMTRGLVLEAKYLTKTLEKAETSAAGLFEINPVARALKIRAQIVTGDRREGVYRRFFDISGKTVIETIQEGLADVYLIDLSSNKREVRIRSNTVHGELELVFERAAVSASNPHQLLVLMVFTGILMTVIAYIFLRNQLRPIRRLGRAAEAFGKGQTVSYKPAGAVEVRAAGVAFLEMRARIERQIEQRTMMLSGVSHDLRTPLTRMRLELALLESSPEVEALRRDVDDMEHLLNAFLDFARDESQEEQELVDPGDVARKAITKASRAGGDVSLGQIQGGGAVKMRPVSVDRALDNLLGNALRYGSRARLSVSTRPGGITFSVEDNGPGIPADRREQALKPFARLDEARNQDRGSGVGLGLAIAADIARSHGGRLVLGDSDDLGGLRADFVLAR
jgi:two-component system osmolarity sensor histidine kinase EnvZ